MDYICRHCGSDLDAGDVLEYFMRLYKPEKAIRVAKGFGWTPHNRLRFDRSIILQGEGQYTICPDCGEHGPLLREKLF